jgi:hypothetical protein
VIGAFRSFLRETVYDESLILIATCSTNKLVSLSKDVRGEFLYEIAVNDLREHDRLQLLNALCQPSKRCHSVDMQSVAQQTAVCLIQFV